ncbi:Lrp/AsnC family transcriptional regulator [Actibacterium sp. 188UL27-1]|uniref:Lrp/AsnC family transcriptional regulator n=1 Tax=Actibacterium sp. 188UL27-1 TaxID=2786961 RepID=UPI0019560744|nr:Lrp/AsnC family transcriptional regulator [Actibacterium sp. 188UL27-1]MBM7070150.1 Lrp/AsnC family transcriptional regulator [Actibacterium sp. 188UL27-1]
MISKPDKDHAKRPSDRPLDALDRRILSALTKDARQTNAALGEQVGLSAPAVHERVKRLRANGIISRTAARLDGPSVGKPLLAFVHVDADGWGKSERMMRLAEFPEVEEMHSVAGDTSVIMKVRAANTLALEHFLSQLYQLPGIRGTKSFIALSTYLDRPVQAEVTMDWPTLHLPPE